MRRRTRATWIIVCLLACACASEHERTSETEGERNVTLASVSVPNPAALPTCNRGHEGEVFYVASESTLYACTNNSWKAIPGGPQGPQGPQGPRGIDGPKGADGSPGHDGTSCSVTDNHDGSLVIACTDGTSVTVKSGKDGVGCSLTDNSDGTRTITCGSDMSVTVQDAVIDYSVFTPQELKDAQLTAVLTSIQIPSDGHPVVELKVSERHGLGVKGLSTNAVRWRFALLKLAGPGINGSANDTWVSYMAADASSITSVEGAAATSFSDHGDGRYTYRFQRGVTGETGTSFEPNLPHRLVILLAATGNPFRPINLVKDFVPASGDDVTGRYEKVDSGACLECHTQFRAIATIPGEVSMSDFHQGNIFDVRTCVACHNDQRRFTRLTSTTVDDSAITADGTWSGILALLNGEATSNTPLLVHRIHMGQKLQLRGGRYQARARPFEVSYPQDIRNCQKCHREPAPMFDTWKTGLSKRACLSCHAERSFEDPAPSGRTLHSGGRADDSQCPTCHREGGSAGDVQRSHQPISPPDPNNSYLNPTTGNSNTNAAAVAAAGFVPEGATVISYDVKQVRLSGTNPQIVFRFMQSNPTALPPQAPTAVVFPTYVPGTVTEMIPGFVGSPSAYFVFAVPQDQTAQPADFNVSASAYLRSLWNGSAASQGTLTGPDASGYYTVTLTSLNVPTEATMLTGGIGYTYSLGTRPTFANNTQPLTQIDLPNYPYTPNASGFGGTGASQHKTSGESQQASRAAAPSWRTHAATRAT